MDTSEHTLIALFAQLGLGDCQEDVDRFLDDHRGLSASVPLADADFLTESQKAFIRQEWELDSAWVTVIDELDVLIRQTG